MRLIVTHFYNILLVDYYQGLCRLQKSYSMSEPETVTEEEKSCDEDSSSRSSKTPSSKKFDEDAEIEAVRSMSENYKFTPKEPVKDDINKSLTSVGSPTASQRKPSHEKSPASLPKNDMKRKHDSAMKPSQHYQKARGKII